MPENTDDDWVQVPVKPVDSRTAYDQVNSAFKGKYGRDLRITSDGQDEYHTRKRIKHDGRLDLGARDLDPEQRSFVDKELKKTGVIYKFYHKGQSGASGDHFHVGSAGTRLGSNETPPPARPAQAPPSPTLALPDDDWIEVTPQTSSTPQKSADELLRTGFGLGAPRAQKQRPAPQQQRAQTQQRAQAQPKPSIFSRGLGAWHTKPEGDAGTDLRKVMDSYGLLSPPIARGHQAPLPVARRRDSSAIAPSHARPTGRLPETREQETARRVAQSRQISTSTGQPTTNIQTTPLASPEVLAAQKEEERRSRRVKNMGWGEYLKQLPKQPSVTAADFIGDTLKSTGIFDVTGLNALERLARGTGDTRDLTSYKVGDWISKNVRKGLESDPDLEQDFFVGQLPSAATSAGIYLGGGLGADAASTAAGVTGAAGRNLAIAALGTGQSGGQIYDEARRSGASERTALTAAAIGAPIIGSSELIGTERFFGNLAKTTGGSVAKQFAKEFAVGFAENYGQEAGQSILQDVNARVFYDDERKIGATANREGLLGGIVGGASNVAATAAGIVRNSVVLDPKTGTLQDARVRDLPALITGHRQAIPEGIYSPLELAPQKTNTQTPQTPQSVPDQRFNAMDNARLQQIATDTSRAPKGASKARRAQIDGARAAAKVELQRRLSTPEPAEAQPVGLQPPPSQETDVPTFREFVEQHPVGGVRFETMGEDEPLYRQRKAEYDALVEKLTPPQPTTAPQPSAEAAPSSVSEATQTPSPVQTAQTALTPVVTPDVTPDVTPEAEASAKPLWSVVSRGKNKFAVRGAKGVVYEGFTNRESAQRAADAQNALGTTPQLPTPQSSNTSNTPAGERKSGGKKITTRTPVYTDETGRQTEIPSGERFFTQTRGEYKGRALPVIEQDEQSVKVKLPEGSKEEWEWVNRERGKFATDEEGASSWGAEHPLTTDLERNATPHELAVERSPQFASDKPTAIAPQNDNETVRVNPPLLEIINRLTNNPDSAGMPLVGSQLTKVVEGLRKEGHAEAADVILNADKKGGAGHEGVAVIGVHPEMRWRGADAEESGYEQVKAHEKAHVIIVRKTGQALEKLMGAPHLERVVTSPEMGRLHGAVNKKSSNNKETSGYAGWDRVRLVHEAISATIEGRPHDMGHHVDPEDVRQIGLMGIVGFANQHGSKPADEIARLAMKPIREEIKNAREGRNERVNSVFGGTSAADGNESGTRDSDLQTGRSQGTRPVLKKSGTAEGREEGRVQDTGEPVRPDDGRVDRHVLAKRRIEESDRREQTPHTPVADEHLLDLAEGYNRNKGKPYRRELPYLNVPEPLVRRMAEAAEDLPSEPDNPRVKASYKALKQSTLDQYEHLTKNGFKFEKWSGQGEPYKNSAEMLKDVRDNKHLFYFPTEAGFGKGVDSNSSPMLERAPNGLLYNDMFRVVHDVMAHGVHGYQFGARGEWNAARAHSETMPEEAHLALVGETAMQNAFVNYGRHLRREDSSIPQKGEKDFVSPTDRPFADQKALNVSDDIMRDWEASARGQSLTLDRFTKNDLNNNATDLHTINGTGGAERSRQEGAPKTIPFYARREDGTSVSPEWQVSGKATTKHTIKGKYRVYDLGTDHDNLRDRFSSDPTAIEKHLHSEGYDGFTNSSYENETHRAITTLFKERVSQGQTSSDQLNLAKKRNDKDTPALQPKRDRRSEVDDLPRTDVRPRSVSTRRGSATDNSSETIARKSTPSGKDIQRAAADLKTFPKNKNGFIGLPSHIKTPLDLAQLRTYLHNLAVDGAPARLWYERSSEAVLDFFGGDKADAEKFVQLLAIYSPSTPVTKNTNDALQAWMQYQLGQPIRATNMPRANQWASDLLYNGKEWGGRKTNNFYLNLMLAIDPSRIAALAEENRSTSNIDVGFDSRGVTIDIWMRKAFGFSPEGMTKAQYDWMVNETKRLSQELGWQPHQAQAAVWTGKRAMDILSTPKAIKEGLTLDQIMSGAAVDYKSTLDDRLLQVSWETARGATHPSQLKWWDTTSFKTKLQYHIDVSKAFLDESGRDLIAKALKIPVRGSFNVTGVFEGAINAGGQTEIAVPKMAQSRGGVKIPENRNRIEPAARTLVDAYAALRGKLLKQDAATWTRPFFDAKVEESNGVALVLSDKRTLSKNEAVSLLETLKRIAPNAMIAVVGSRDGAWLLNLDADAVDNKTFHKYINQASREMEYDNEIGFHLRNFASDGNYIENDWRENGEGQAYQSYISKSGRSDILRGVENEISSRIDKIDQEYEAKYGEGRGKEKGTASQASAEEVGTTLSKKRRGTFMVEGASPKDVFFQYRATAQAMRDFVIADADFAYSEKNKAHQINTEMAVLIGQTISAITGQGETGVTMGQFMRPKAVRLMTEIWRQGLLPQLHTSQAVNSLVDVLDRLKTTTSGFQKPFTFYLSPDTGTIVHEKFHESSYKGAELTSGLDNELADRHNADDLDRLYALPEAQELKSKLLRGYPDVKPLIVEELAAHIAGGQAYDYGITPKDQLNYLTKWFESYIKQNGTVSVKQFRKDSANVRLALQRIFGSPDGRLRGVHDGRTQSSAAASGESQRGSKLDASRSGEDTGSAKSRAEKGSQKLTDEGQLDLLPRSAKSVTLSKKRTSEKEDGEVYFSPTEEVISELPQDKATGDQFLKMIQNRGGKPEEIKWSGIDEWLKERAAAKLTKEAVLKQFAENNISIEEVVKGQSSEAYVGAWWNDEGGANEEKLWEDLTTAERAAAARQYKNEVGDYEEDSTKFSQHTLPNGENYRELLLTLPTDSKLPPFKEWIKTRPYLQSHDRLEQINTYNELAMEAESRAGAYHSSHFDEPNILAHVRFDERTDASGKRVLFIEEVQSDWHREGRQKGYGVKKSEITITEEVKGGQTFYSLRENGNVIFTSRDRNLVESEKKSVLQQKPEMGVPDAPYKKNWHELVMRRMTRWAAENGFDRLAWITGDQTADRYDLSKHVSGVTYDPASKTLTVEMKDTTKEPEEIRDVTPEKLEDYIGKEPAQRLLDSDTNSYGEHVLSGIDLKMGGEWARNLYDRMLPQYMEKFGKKWGAKVGETNIPTTATSAVVTPYDRTVVEEGDPDYDETPFTVVGYIGDNGEVIKGFDTEQEARSYLDARNSATLPVHSIDITPSMRDSVMEKGVALAKKTTPLQTALSKNPFDEKAWLTEAKRLNDGNLLPSQENALKVILRRGTVAQRSGDTKAQIAANRDALEHVTYLKPTSLTEFMGALVRSSILSAATVTGGNVTANLFNLGAGRIDQFTAGALEYLHDAAHERTLNPKIRQIMGVTGIPAQTAHMFSPKTLWEATQAFSRTMYRGFNDDPSELTKYEMHREIRLKKLPLNAQKLIEWPINIPLRFQGAQDAVFHTVAFRGALYEQAWLKAKKNGTDVWTEYNKADVTMVENAHDAALYTTAQEDNAAAEAIQKFKANAWVKPLLPIVGQETLFVKTPLNVFRQGMERLGLRQLWRVFTASVGGDSATKDKSFQEVWNSIGDEHRRAIIMSASRGAVGATMGFLALALVSRGLLTGFNDDKDRRQAAAKEAAGLREGTLTINGRHYNLNNKGAIPMAMIAYATYWEKTNSQYAKDQSVLDNLIDITQLVLSGNPLSQAQEHLSDLKDNPSKIINRWTDPTKLVPLGGALKSIAKATDDSGYQRDTRDEDFVTEQQNRLKMITPTTRFTEGRESLPERLDYRGRPLPDSNDPFFASTPDTSDAVDHEVLSSGFRPTAPKFDRKKDVTREQYRERLKSSTTNTNRFLTEGTGNERYQHLPEGDERRDALGSLQREATRTYKYDLKPPSVKRNADLVLMKPEVEKETASLITEWERNLDHRFSDDEREAIIRRASSLLSGAKLNPDRERNLVDRTKSDRRLLEVKDTDLRRSLITKAIISVFRKDEAPVIPYDEPEEKEQQ